jgi:hypothetical protein
MYYIACYALMGAFLTLIAMWIDTKLFDNPKTRSTYIKGMFATAISTAIIISFIGEKNLGHTKMRGGGANTVGLSYIPSIKEEIITGPPNF